MKNIGLRSVLTLVILAMAVFIGQRVVTHMEENRLMKETAPKGQEQGADAWIQGFSYQQTQSGATKWVVTASQAKVFEDQHEARLQQVKIQLFDEEFQNEQMHILSEEGIMNTLNNDFDLRSQDRKTVMTFESGLQVFSNQLSWNEESRQLHTPDSVLIQGEGLTITGTGLVGDAKANEFRLLNNVRAEMVSP